MSSFSLFLLLNSTKPVNLIGNISCLQDLSVYHLLNNVIIALFSGRVCLQPGFVDLISLLIKFTCPLSW